MRVADGMADGGGEKDLPLDGQKPPPPPIVDSRAESWEKVVHSRAESRAKDSGQSG